MSDKSTIDDGTQLISSALTSTPYTDATKLRVNTKRIPRPMNSFMLWAKEERPRIRAQYPHYHNAQISQILGMEWKGMPMEQKMSYQERAKELRVLHSMEFPDYKYRPRKRLAKIPSLAKEHNYVGIGTPSEMETWASSSSRFLIVPIDETPLFGFAPVTELGEYGSLIQDTPPSPQGGQGNPSPESGFNDDFTEETDLFNISTLSPPAVTKHSAASFHHQQLGNGLAVPQDDDTMSVMVSQAVSKMQFTLEQPNSYEMYGEYAMRTAKEKLW
ncbi:hypothetical protein M514_08915 [Trichuris suis]|uniref:Sex-determining region Y protein n=1 Tax=Trichuris suis TaxID=68888 RepID=A0A085LYX4_9BILA|nr:hypothetical protein M513_08915 [Trichuris suis]KFD70430.1 hypothetical protein M514_08915 [Trichuris suis]